MNKIFITFLCFAFSTILCDIKAQDNTHTISGKIAENMKPLEYISVFLTTQADSTKVIAVATSDSLGFFKIEHITSGNYTLNVKGVGYITKKLEINLLAAKPYFDLHTIELQPHNILLQEVNVVFFRKSIKRTEQGFMIEANDNLIQASGNAADLIKNMPTVQVDADGVVTIRGKTPLITINGRVSGLTGVDRNAQLEQIPASNIERIEINNNPSAKYQADAEAGIINIVLKNNKESGTNGAFSAGLGYGAKERLNGSVMLNHNTEKWNLGLYYNNWYTVRTRSVDGNRVNYNLPSDYYLTQKRRDSRQVNNQELRLNTAFAPNTKNRFSFNNAWAYNEQDNNETLTSTSESVAKDFAWRNTRHSLEIRKFNAFESELNYDRTFYKDGQSLTANIITSFDDEKENTDIDVKKLNRDYTRIGNIGLEQTKSYQYSNITTASVDYKMPVGISGSFETGSKSMFRYLNADYKTLGYNTGNYVINPLRSNIYTYKEQIHAMYAQYLGRVGTKAEPMLNYEIGLRAEEVITYGKNSTISNKIIGNYFHLFPSANVTFYPKPSYFLRLSYSNRINRPGLGALNPFIDITDSLNQHSGNPYLKPELVHSFELVYNRDWQTTSLSIAPFYRYNSNSILPYISYVGNGVYLSKPINVGNTVSYGLEGVYMLNSLKFWNANLSFSLFKTEIKGVDGQEGIATNILGWNSKLINNFALWKDAKLQITANYTSPVAIPQGKKLEIFYTDIGFQQKMFKNKGRMGIVFTDIFHSQQSGSVTSGNLYYFHRVSRIDSRAILVTFAYTFGSSLSEKLMENKFQNY